MYKQNNVTSEPASKAGAEIRGTGISKTFQTPDGPFNAIQPVDFEIKSGEFVSLIGPSGCGKSTLMLIIAGLLNPTSGDILINGQRLDKPLTDVGIVFQDHLLLDFRTALDNVLLQTQVRGLPREEAREEAFRLLRELGLEKAKDRYPQQLSGGMRQRVSLARALIHNPSVLLMDEPFGALDAITRTQMKVDLETLWMEKRKTVVFITHSVEEAVGLSDRVLVMSPSPGKIIEEIKIELPRPRPIKIGEDASFTHYTDQLYDIMRKLGVLKF